MFTAQLKWKSQDDRRKVGQKVQDIVPEEATARYGLATAQQPFTWVFDLLLYLLHNIGQATQPILIFLYCSDSPNSSSDDETGVPDGQAGVPDGQAGVPAQGQAGVAGAGSFKESRGGRIFNWAGREEISSPDTSCSRCGQTLIFRFLFPAEKSMICQLFELPFKSNQFCSMQFLRVSATTSEGCCGALQRNVRTFVYSWDSFLSDLQDQSQTQLSHEYCLSWTCAVGQVS